MFDNKTEAYYSIVFAAVFALLLIAVIIFTAVLYFNRKKRNLLEKNALEAEFSQTLLKTQIEIQEQTLKTISQEIHDNIGQVLSLAKLNLNTMDISNTGELQEKIVDSKKLVSKAIQDLRDLSKSLNTDNIAAIGLITAIGYELDMIRKAGIETLLESEGDIVKMEPQRELIVFRIVQESLNNIIKHAGAKKITVNAVYSASDLTLTVADDGLGVDLTPINDVNNATGLGIRNMHNRATLIGGDFSINSITAVGTTVKLVLPFTKTNA